jgi:hypothetical protein
MWYEREVVYDNEREDSAMPWRSTGSRRSERSGTCPTSGSKTARRTASTELRSAGVRAIVVNTIRISDLKRRKMS